MTAIITPEKIRTASLYPLATLAERTAGTIPLVITRYWPRGLKRGHLQWARDMAPSATLLDEYKHGGMDWESFEAAYRAEMAYVLPDIHSWLYWWLNSSSVTLLCHEHDAPEETVRCHRRLLRDLLLEHATNQEVTQ